MYKDRDAGGLCHPTARACARNMVTCDRQFSGSRRGGLLGAIGLVLSYVVSPMFLILFGLANVLTLALYWLHLQNDDVHNRQYSHDILAEPFNIESKVLSILFTAYLFLGFFLVSLSEFVSVACAIAGFILVLELYFFCKKAVD